MKALQASVGQAAAEITAEALAPDVPGVMVIRLRDIAVAKTHRLWRELPNFQNVVLKDGGHLSAVMEGFVPQLYIDELTAFVVRNNPKS